MPYKWMLVGALLTAAAPTYLFFQGDRLEAAIVGIPSVLIAVTLLACISAFRTE
jgi:hypothetical protein